MASHFTLRGWSARNAAALGHRPVPCRLPCGPKRLQRVRSGDAKKEQGYESGQQDEPAQPADANEGPSTSYSVTAAAPEDVEIPYKLIAGLAGMGCAETAYLTLVSDAVVSGGQHEHCILHSACVKLPC